MNNLSSLTQTTEATPEIPVYIKYPDSQEFASPSLRKELAPVLPGFFSRELLNIGGRDRFGDPRLRIVWAQDRFRIVNGETWAVYICQRRITADGYRDIGIPRFVIEEKIDPLWLLPGWQERLQGPKPVRGLYQYVMTIQDENGNFVYPDMRHLRMMERARFERDADPLYTSHEEKDPDYVRARKIQEIRARHAMAQEKKDLETRDMIRNHYKERLRRITHLHPNEGRVPEKKRIYS